jgi:purine-binding chemotaxis protein CheW
LPLESVVRIAPMAQLARPPGLPSPVEGILNFGGTAVPVVRLDRLLHLRVQEVGLYSMLIILKGFALLVERASEVLPVSSRELLPLREEDSFNACAEATVSLRGQTVHLLLPQRILLEKERQAVLEIQASAQQRIHEWQVGWQGENG